MMSEPLIRTFSYHCRLKYGRAVGKIPLDTGTACPNRTYGGCIFCRPASFTPESLRSGDTIEHQVKRGKKLLLAGRFSAYLAYFQQETATAVPAGTLLPILKTVLADDACYGLILSTRPDFVADALLEPLSELVEASGKECLLELGLQSIHEKSLRLLNRNHTLDDFIDAGRRIGKYPNLQLGAHLIFGIPGESTRDMLETVRFVGECGVHALKLHHLQVVADTLLHEMYNEGKVSLFSLEEYLELLMLVLPEIPPSVTIHRLWTTSHPDILIAPRWNILAADLSARLREEMERRGIRQGCRCTKALPE